jgi:hypothetical protein
VNVEGDGVPMSTRGSLIARWVLIVVVLAGLAVDAYVHFNLAAPFDAIKSSTLSEGDLFRVEGSLAVVAAVALLIRPRRYTAAFAFLVTAGGFAAVMVYQYVDVGAFGPFPDMYDPIWYPKKTWSAWGEGIAALAALALLVMLQVQSRQAARSVAPAEPSPVKVGG